MEAPLVSRHGVNSPWAPKPWRVTSVRRENLDTVTLVAEPDHGGPAPISQPGQFNMLYVFGIGEIPISISSIGPRSITHTIRSVGAVSEALTRLSERELIGIRGPFGHPWPLPSAEGLSLLLMAGGVGLAPLRPVVEEALRTPKRFGPVHLLYGTRDPEHILYRDELSLWSRGGIKVHLTVDTADQSWEGDVGVVTQLLDRLSLDFSETVAFLCGPEIMMRFCIDGLVERGALGRRIFLSMERNMKCALAWCGHCQYGSVFVCKDGPVFQYEALAHNLKVKEL